MKLINSKTMVPPFNSGRNVTDDHWNGIFQKGPKKNYETEEEYQSRIKKNKEPDKVNS